MKIRPVSDVLLVQLEPARTATPAGIIRPDTKQHPIRAGRVLRTGPGRWWKDRRSGKWSYWAMEVKAGDRIVFLAALLQTGHGRQMQRSFALDENQALIRETDVMLVIPEGEDVEIDV